MSTGRMSNLTHSDLEHHLASFRLSSFRTGQREVISAVLDGHDCLCIMPTGGGKSLCYQLPSIAREGITLVISPLIALMKDQVDSLEALGIRASCINSSLSLPEQQIRLEQLARGEYDLVYVAPERLRNQRFLEAVRGTRIQLLAVDEAHCVSEWGHDFRPDYARLGRFRQRLGNPQTIALTATATPYVRDDIALMLQLREPRVFVSGFARENLHFEVQDVSNGREKDQRLLEFLRETPGAGIVYASSRKRCEEVRQLIASELKRAVGTYHAGLLPDERRRVQEDFMADRLQIVTATNAFGMGIDKPDLRFVVHYNMPGSLEAYYQEAGRAGRDGQPARCLLLYTYQDRYIQEFFIENAYPSRETVQVVYEYLRTLDDDPIEITLEDLKERLELPVGAEGVGACERLLEKSGALERMDSGENRASARLDSDLPTLVDLLPKEAKVQRRVLRAIEQEVGERRWERVYFHPQRIASALEMDRDAVLRALRELNRLAAFDYVPAFRGRAVHLLARDKPFQQLEIDFEELAARRQAEYDKLERVIRFARARGCRQLEILDYFGDPDRRDCGRCDNCTARRSAPVASATVAAAGDAQVIKAVRIVLSGVARAQGRFGKVIIAQMLCGSKAAKVLRFRLDQLSTFGLLGHLKLPEITELIDATLAAGLLDQADVERNRPVLRLTDLGNQVMRGQTPLPESFSLSVQVARRLSGTSDSESKSHGAFEGPHPEREEMAANPRLMKELRDWRRQAAAAVGWPAFRILSNAVLSRLAAEQPADLVQLLDVKGIGPIFAHSYGEEVLAIIARHRTGSPPAAVPHAAAPPAEDHPESIREPVRSYHQAGSDAAEPVSVSPPPLPARAETIGQNQVKPNYYWSWRLLYDGFTADECKQIRRLDDQQLVAHLLQAIDQELPVDAAWILQPDHLALLDQVVGDQTPARLRPLLQQLPPEIRHEHLQLYLYCRATGNQAEVSSLG
jgi:ATP-dependent DNA helicase RecQ